MRRTIGTLVSALALASSLVGCGGESDRDTGPTPLSAEEKQATEKSKAEAAEDAETLRTTRLEEALRNGNAAKSIERPDLTFDDQAIQCVLNEMGWTRVDDFTMEEIVNGDVAQFEVFEMGVPDGLVTCAENGTLDPSASRTAQQSPTTSDADAKVGNAQTVALAGDVIKAYTQHSFRDAGPTTWMERVKPMATAGLMNNLVEVFGNDPEADTVWEHEVVAQQREKRTTILDVHLSGMHDNEPNRFTYVVEYETALKTKDMDEWTNPPRSITQFVRIEKVDGKWKVGLIRPTSDRQASTFE